MLIILYKNRRKYESRYIKLIFQLSLIKKKVTVIADIGDNMRAIRKHLGVTQERLAELSGLSVNFIIYSKVLTRRLASNSNSLNLFLDWGCYV